MFSDFVLETKNTVMQNLHLPFKFFLHHFVVLFKLLVGFLRELKILGLFELMLFLVLFVHFYFLLKDLELFLELLGLELSLNVKNLLLIFIEGLSVRFVLKFLEDFLDLLLVDLCLLFVSENFSVCKFNLLMAGLYFLLSDYHLILVF